MDICREVIGGSRAASTTREQTLERCPNLALASVFFTPGTEGSLVPVGNTNRD